MKILLAVDGSPFGDQAAAEVARRVWEEGSEVRVVSCIEPPDPPTIDPWRAAAYYSPELERAKRLHAEAAIARAAETLKSGTGTKNLNVTTAVLDGVPKREIVEEAVRCGADLIVVGSRGRGALERFFLGSVSLALATGAPCSVEIVREKQRT